VDIEREKTYGEERRSPRRDEDAGRVYSERELMLTTTRKMRYLRSEISEI